MLDFVIFAFTSVGLIVISLLLFYYFEANKRMTSGASPIAIPRWNSPPADSEKGDLDVMMKKFGSLHQYLLHLHDNGKSPVISFWWGKTHVVSFCSPQAFKESAVLVNRPVELFLLFESLFTRFSITYANDKDWALRSKYIYQTLKGNDLKSYFPHFVQIAQETESAWSSHAPNKEVSLMHEVFPMTIKGIARCCLGDVFESEDELDRLTDSYHKCWKTMEEGVPEAGSDGELEFLKHKQVLVDIIVADTLTFMVGGFHTSGYMFTWMLWYLADHPECQSRLRAEIDRETGGERGDRLKEYALRNDTFLRQVQDETIRLSTLGPWAARYSDEDVTLCGYTVPAKTPMIHALGVGLKNETTWKNVHSWDPDRFPPNGRRGNEFCPFGVHSRRKCPGYLFSYFEVGVFASILLSRFMIIPVEGQTVIQVHGLVTEPKEEIMVFIRPRESA